MTINTNLQIVIKYIYPTDEADGTFPSFIKELKQIDDLKDLLTQRFLNDSRLYNLMSQSFVNEVLINENNFSKESVDIWTKKNGDYSENENKLIESYLNILTNYPDLDGNMLDLEILQLLKDWRKIELTPKNRDDYFYCYKLINMMPIPTEFHFKSLEIEDINYNEEDENLFELDDLPHSAP